MKSNESIDYESEEQDIEEDAFLEDFSLKRQNGVYETPYKTAIHMVNLVKGYIKPTSLILDPAVGDGVFIKALIESGIESKNIYAHDIDEIVVNYIKKTFTINVTRKDSLLDNYEKFDIIIGNPPYKSRRNNNYFKENKNLLEKLYGHIVLYNLYSLFIVNSIVHLNDGGVLCFIVEDAFMTNRYYKKFRKFLLDHTRIIELKLAPWRLFHQSGADVRTVIITCQKKDKLFRFLNTTNKADNSNKIRLVDRVKNENEYDNPPNVQYCLQNEFKLNRDYCFYIGVPDELIYILRNSPLKFGDIAKGGAGISTGNDSKYLKSAEEVKNNPEWVMFYKSGKRTPYYYETLDYIEKDYLKNAINDPKNFLIRNEKFFFKEGMTCSSVGRRFSASYLPPGSLFGVNANFFFNDKNDLIYSLGFLNSSLVSYISRKVLSRSNIISTTFLKDVPFIPPNQDEKQKVIELVNKIITRLKENKDYDFHNEQLEIDNIIYNLYNISSNLKKEINSFCDNIMELV